MSLEPGREVGGQRGWIYRCGLIFQIKRASNNIQQKGSTMLPVARCRCASEDGGGSLLKRHLFSFLRGILHCLP